MNLVNWYPFIAPFKDGDWVIREPWSHGEYLVYPIGILKSTKFVDPQTAPSLPPADLLNQMVSSHAIH
ncbi:hypothetical protein [Candidatus Villigracilis affinis]|uniref:hypothetical protein n=1 Tax=Candidatus Villigracilis affinis TaxID=3140682 RepID=UPI002A208653|nr:hypothetical protein [Anaerolineales bacterium]